jgi:hypothetical protein
LDSADPLDDDAPALAGFKASTSAAARQAHMVERT